jgi:hypothetical protein
LARLNRRLSKTVSKKIPFAENRCFQNGFWALRHVPNHATLVIGTARISGCTLRHAWIEIGNTIIDPSWIGLLEKGDRPEYWAAHRYTKVQVKKLRILKLGRVHREPIFSQWYQLNPDNHGSVQAFDR